MGWPVTPAGLGQMLRMLAGRGVEAVYVTENGAAYPDTIQDGETVDDQGRRSYLERHLVEAARSIADGVPLRGYFAWTLLDNFEWSFGYSRRFGLVHVDHVTQRRTPKGSAYWYRDVIIRNGL